MRKQVPPKPIIRIREIMRDVKIDAREAKIPRQVLKRIITCMEEVTDLREAGMIEYPLSYILLLAFLAVLCGAESWGDMQTFSESYKVKLNGMFPHYKGNAVPSHDTFRRVFGLISPSELQMATSMFIVREISQLKKTLGIEDTGYRQIGIDGKEQKGTGRKYGTSEKISNLQTLHCYDITNGICIYSEPIEAKTNEIPVAQTLLSKMELKNTVVTFDALNTQKETIAVIVAGKGDYVGGLKGNQELFHKEVELYFSDEELLRLAKQERNFLTDTEKSHNRIEKRSYYMTTRIDWFADKDKWSNLNSFICYELETEDIVSGKRTKERRYYISSLKDILLCSDAIRSHWGIENQLHWHLDVTFSEDDNTTIDKNAFNNLSIINKMVLSLLKLVQPSHKQGLKGIRKKFGWDLKRQLTHLLGLLDEDLINRALQSVGHKA